MDVLNMILKNENLLQVRGRRNIEDILDLGRVNFNTPDRNNKAKYFIS